MMIFNQTDVWQGKSLKTYGEYSEDEVKFFGTILKPGDTVVEIGACIGCHTVPMARFVGESGCVMAFEPERYAYYTLAANVAINNLRQIWAFQQAFGETSGSIDVPEIDPNQNQNIGGLELWHDFSQVAHYPVAKNTVDGLQLRSCKLLKVDVEGMELPVLKGAAETLDKFSPYLYVEDDRQQFSEELRAHIKSKGYKIWVHQPLFFNPNNFYDVKENVFPGFVSSNLFCCKGDCPFDPCVAFGMTPAN